MSIREYGSKPTKFSGELARPFKMPPMPKPVTTLGCPEGSTPEKETEARMAKWRSDSLAAILKTFEKLPMLFEHYDIHEKGESRWCSLAIALAFDFVPAFQVDRSKSPGRKNEWDMLTLTWLYMDVRAETKSRSDRGKTLSELDACRQLLKREPWNAMTKIKDAKTLHNRFIESKKSPLVIVAERVRNDPRVSTAYDDFLTIMNQVRDDTKKTSRK